MKGPEAAGAFLGAVESAGARDTWVHRLDARAKLLAVLLFTGVVLSYPKYAVGPLLPLFLFPLLLIRGGRLPAGPLLKRLAVLLPFALPAGVFNPFIDREPLLRVGGVVLSGGMVSLLSVLIRYFLTAGAVLALLGTTGFGNLCSALARLGVPRALVMQLFLTYRYLHVLLAEGGRMARARTLRGFRRAGRGARSLASLLGTLLLRSLDRAHRVECAMRSRGFDGRFHGWREGRFGGAEIAFLAGTAMFVAAARFADLPLALGRWITGGGG